MRDRMKNDPSNTDPVLRRRFDMKSGQEEDGYYRPHCPECDI